MAKVFLWFLSMIMSFNLGASAGRHYDQALQEQLCAETETEEQMLAEEYLDNMQAIADDTKKELDEKLGISEGETEAEETAPAEGSV